MHTRSFYSIQTYYLSYPSLTSALLKIYYHVATHVGYIASTPHPLPYSPAKSAILAFFHHVPIACSSRDTYHVIHKLHCGPSQSNSDSHARSIYSLAFPAQISLPNTTGHSRSLRHHYQTPRGHCRCLRHQHKRLPIHTGSTNIYIKKLFWDLHPLFGGPSGLCPSPLLFPHPPTHATFFPKIFDPTSIFLLQGGTKRLYCRVQRSIRDRPRILLTPV
jgi:hypothetical protein